MALALPLLDTGIAVTRRFLRREPIFGADRGHIHHRLLDRGLTPRMAALVLYGVCGLAAGFSLLLQMANQQFSGVIVSQKCSPASLARRTPTVLFPVPGIPIRLMVPGILPVLFKADSPRLSNKGIWKLYAAHADVVGHALARATAAG